MKKNSSCIFSAFLNISSWHDKPDRGSLETPVKLTIEKKELEIKILRNPIGCAQRILKDLHLTWREALLYLEVMSICRESTALAF